MNPFVIEVRDLQKGDVLPFLFDGTVEYRPILFAAPEGYGREDVGVWFEGSTFDEFGYPEEGADLTFRPRDLLVVYR